ncbi:uncharacterized protein LOC128229889 isoform X1 [Mya arenaria]|uniref:uncharacterized protein LOC128229889 isoform X1 n=1 Tax=Mya arenaria TaxID=6604 RepID=UPI0022E988F6|nr:uncharacterized protein LOC128229889 isoform X1 [Mya arenaria]
MATGMWYLFRTYSPYQDQYQPQQPYSRTPDKVSASHVENGVTSGASASGYPDLTSEPTVKSSPQEQTQPLNDEYLFNICNQYHCFEFESDSPIKTSLVKGSLKNNVHYWKTIGTNPDMIDVIENGYKIPFISMPERTFSKNNQSALSNIEFVKESIDDMLKNGFIEQTDFPPHVVSPLSVSVNKSGKKRLILDLRIVNKYIWKEKMTFEDWKVGVEYFEKDSYCYKFDLSKGYYHIDIFPEHKTFLGFSLEGKYYCYSVVAFGLSSAPFIFSKALREMVKFWRFNGIKIVMFLDDGWGTNKSCDLATRDAIFVKDSLNRAGLIINDEKSVWLPVQNLEWIGLLWNSIDYSISIPARRIEDFKMLLLEFLNSLHIVSARSLAKCTGKVISMMPVIGNIARLMTRFMYIQICSRTSWDFPFSLEIDCPCISEIRFWLEHVDNSNYRKLGKCTAVDTLEEYSVASSFACGAHIVNMPGFVFHDMWSEDDKDKSSTFREMKAVFLALRAYGHSLANHKIGIFCYHGNARIVESESGCSSGSGHFRTAFSSVFFIMKYV